MRIQKSVMFRLGSNHEFDIYFARAALEELENGVEDSRRGSLPSAPPHGLIIQAREDRMPKRAASCKYPSRTRRKKGGSVSPRERDGSRATTLVESETAEPTEEAARPAEARPQAEARPTHQQLTVPGGLDAALLAPGPKPDFKCHSAPHSRSSSWKKARRPPYYSKNTPTDNSGEDSGGRSRTGSVPFEECINVRLEHLRLLEADDCCVVRNFSTTSRGLINRGDSFKRKSISVASDAGSGGSGPGDAEQACSVHSEDSTGPSSGEAQISKVLIVGSHGVGKTALVQQFMTSEYMGAMETSFDDEMEKTVSVLLDGEETMLDLYELPPDQDYRSVDNVDAYVMIYSINDRKTFVSAMDNITELRTCQQRHPAIILVANKSDLVRTRQVTSDEGRELCLKKDCKYIEVSAQLNHKVDDLLVGVVSQIRLNPQRLQRRKCATATPADKKAVDTTCAKGAKGLLKRIFKKQMYASKSCDNLLVL